MNGIIPALETLCPQITPLSSSFVVRHFNCRVVVSMLVFDVNDKIL